MEQLAQQFSDYLWISKKPNTVEYYVLVRVYDNTNKYHYKTYKNILDYTSYQFKGKNNHETTKLYYNLMNQIDSAKHFNKYKTTVQLIGPTGTEMYLSTYKKLF